VVTAVISAFKVLYSVENPTLRNAYVYAKHGSPAISSVTQKLKDLCSEARDQETSRRLTIILSICEPLLVNDQNLEVAVREGLFTQLIELLIQSTAAEKPEQYLKYAVRCITSCLRNDQCIP